MHLTGRFGDCTLFHIEMPSLNMKMVIFWWINRSFWIGITDNPPFETNSHLSFIRKCITLAAVVLPLNTVFSYSRRQQQNTSAPFDKNQDDLAKVRSKQQLKKASWASFKNIPPPQRCAFSKLLSFSAIKVIWVLSSGDGGRPRTPSRHRTESIFFP